MSGSWPGPAWRKTATTVICVDKDPAKVRALQRGKIPIYEPGLEELVRRNTAEKRLTFTTALDRGVRSSQIIFIAVGTPTGEDGSADLQHVLGVARDIGPGDERLQGHRQQEHGACRHGRQGARSRPPRDDAPLQCRQQPRVPEAGRRDRRLHEAGPRGHRRRGSPGGGADAGALCPVHADRRADHADGLRQRGAVQVRRERHAGDADLVHERSGECLRSGGRQRRPGPPGGGLRPPDRSVVPVPGRRLRRQLLSQGREGDAAVRGHQELRLQDPAGRRGGQRPAEAAAAREVEDAFRIAEGEADRGVGARVQAAHRRHARSAGGAAHQGTAGRRGDRAGLRSRSHEGREDDLRLESPSRTTATRR